MKYILGTVRGCENWAAVFLRRPPVPSDKRISLDLNLVYNVHSLLIHIHHQVEDSLIEALKIEPTKVVNHQHRGNNSDQVREAS